MSAAPHTIYIARHGFRLNWVTQNWPNVTGTPKDPPLAAYGEAQSKELAAYFLGLPKEERPTAIFSSPYYRCLQTSVPCAEALGLPIYVEHGLSEWYSPVAPGTGLHPRPSLPPDLLKYVPGIDPSWTPTWIPSRQGETVEEVHSRVGGFLSLFVPRVQNAFGHKHILLISHAATVIALTRELVGNRDLSFRVGCCSVTAVAADRSNQKGVLGSWALKQLASADHLSGGVARDWGFEDIRVSTNGLVVDDPGTPGTEDEIDTSSGPQSFVPPVSQFSVDSKI
ncbi:phosphoglycerate mutase-like protein [Sistotremastrum niveocremeum HHB9708]|uniref:Phosphoglycerate mutase-like protein n=1 Tax=Sistotremastrum niveocremeum HHB9708 TaxID=1314777 RepID=A0A164U821_9AGAM|nr:phosphoglycerate mutase-like protein [Sistotremastrum niveocremeum HHB9708]